MAALLAVMAFKKADCDSACRGRFYIGVFVVAWIGQFYGHKVEGKKNKNSFLLQGPAIPPDWPCMVHGRLSG